MPRLSRSAAVVVDAAATGREPRSVGPLGAAEGRGHHRALGVDPVHGEVSRRLFLPLFPRWPEDDVPIGHVTNGVHMPTWDSAAADDLWTESCGKGRWLGTMETLDQDIRRISDARLWQFRTAVSKSLVEYARERLSLELSLAGAPPEGVEAAKHIFDPNALTLGFARRFATYKNPTCCCTIRGVCCAF